MDDITDNFSHEIPVINMLPKFSVVLFITSLNMSYQRTFQLKAFLQCLCVCVCVCVCVCKECVPEF